MNTYIKYCPNVFAAKCDEQHEKGDVITLTTQHGKEHECIIFNHLGTTKSDGKHVYSIVRADGFNVQEYAKQRAERRERWAASAERKSNAAWEASHEGREFLSLGEPIKVGHHSEKKHRALIERNHNRMRESVEQSKKAEDHLDKAEYWKSKANTINLSMPESVEYFEHLLDEAREKHEGLKNGTIPRAHSYSLTYAKKEVKDLETKLATARKLWS
jgi:Domain of unknown function (DUF3560)